MQAAEASEPAGADHGAAQPSAWVSSSQQHAAEQQPHVSDPAAKAQPPAVELRAAHPPHVSWWRQAAAVARKNWALQRRSWLANLFLVILPCVLLALMLAIQALIDMELADRQYACGCQCLACCDWVELKTFGAGGGGQNRTRGTGLTAVTNPVAGGGKGVVGQVVVGADGVAYEWRCFNASADSPCSPNTADCKVYNDSNCGYQYSSYSQVAFCEVAVPPTWPAVLQIPLDKYRARDQLAANSTSATTSAAVTRFGSSTVPGLFNLSQPPVLLPFTGADKALATELTSRLIPPDSGVGARLLRGLNTLPALFSTGSTGNRSGQVAGSSPAGVTQDLCLLLQQQQAGGGTGNGSTGGTGALGQDIDYAAVTEALSQVFADAGITLGTPADVSRTLLLEPAFIARSPVLGSGDDSGGGSGSSGSGGGGMFGSAGGSSSSSLGGSSGSDDVQLGEVLPLYLASRSCASLADTPTDARLLSQLACGLQLALGVPLECATMAPEWRASRSDIERELYCGWRESHCDATAGSTGGAVPSSPGPPASFAPTTNRRLLSPSAATTTATPSAVPPASSAVARLPTPAAPATASTAPKPPAAAGVGAAGLSGANQSAAGGVMGVGSDASPGAVPAAEVGSGQYPSLIVDWGQTRVGGGGGAGPAFEATLLLNNTNVQASVAPAVQRWPAAVAAAASSFRAAAWARWAAARAQASNGNGTASAAQPDPSKPPELRLEGVAGFPTAGGRLSIDLASLLGPLFVMWVLQLLLPVYVYQLASERAGGQAGLMARQGLGRLGAAAATYAWALCLYIVYVAVFVAFGAGAGLGFFTRTAPGVQILLYLTWFHSMLAQAMWMAAFYEGVVSGVLASCGVLIFTGLVANLVVVQFVQSGPEWLALLLQVLVPPFALFRALWEAAQWAFLADSSGGHGLTLDVMGRGQPGEGAAVALGLMVVHAALLAWFATYWQMVFGSGELSGPRAHPLFWLGAKSGPDEPRGAAWFAHRSARNVAAVRAAFHRCFGVLGARNWRQAHAAGKWEWGVEGMGQGRGGQGGAGSARAHGVLVRAGRDEEGAAPAPYGESDGPPRVERNGPVRDLNGSAGHANGPVDGADVAAERSHVERLWCGLADPDLNSPSQQQQSGWFRSWHRPGAQPRALPMPLEVNGPGGPLSSPLIIDAPAVLMRGVRKVFQAPAQLRLAGSSAGSSARDKVAVAGLWLTVGRGECFGLLGPNGAGKTTTLRLMQGLLEPSAGQVAVCGLDLSQHPDACARLTGICPQHDALWGSLSASDHLALYGALRGLTGRALSDAVALTLASLGLTAATAAKPVSQTGGPHTDGDLPAPTPDGASNARSGTCCTPILQAAGLQRLWAPFSRKAHSGSRAHVPVSSLSGGQRRRVSVGCALVGQPPLALVDEPSAGLDPGARAALWQALRGVRSAGTAVVITTHSMGEAEALCDRLGIFVGGHLRCVGSAQELAVRHAGSLLLSLTTPPHQAAAAAAAVLAQVCPSARCVYASGGASSWELPRREVHLSDVFAGVGRLRGDVQLLDWGVSTASLAHVFDTIVAAAAAEDEQQQHDEGEEGRHVEGAPEHVAALPASSSSP